MGIPKNRPQIGNGSLFWLPEKTAHDRQVASDHGCQVCKVRFLGGLTGLSSFFFSILNIINYYIILPSGYLTVRHGIDGP